MKERDGTKVDGGGLSLVSDEGEFRESCTQVFREYHITDFSSNFNVVFGCDLKNAFTSSSAICVFRNVQINSVNDVRHNLLALFLLMKQFSETVFPSPRKQLKNLYLTDLYFQLEFRKSPSFP